MKMWWRVSLVGVALIAGCGGCPGSEPAPDNVVVISMDTLRADHVGCYGYQRDTTPNIDGLARRGVVFEEVSSTSGWTAPGHASMFTGRYPSQFGVVRFRGRKNARKIDKKETMLAEVLEKQGFETVAFTGGGFVSSKLGFGQGFQRYENHGDRFRRYFDDALTWLERRRRREREGKADKPFFMLVHYYDPHRPYTPPRKYRKRFRGDYEGDFPVEKVCKLKPEGEDLEYVISQYDGEIAHGDVLTGTILDKLEATGHKDDTLVIFTSDHGEEFFEHGSCDHISSVYEELVHVPFIMAGPGIEAGQSVDTPASVVDLAPTVLDALGLSVPKSMEGQSLLPIMRGDAEAREYQYFETGYKKEKSIRRGVRGPSWKLVVGPKGPRELYNLDDDPGEQDNRIDDPKAQDKKKELVEAYRAWRERVTPDEGAEPDEGANEQAKSKDAGADAGGGPVDETLEKQLRALGYAE